MLAAASSPPCPVSMAMTSPALIPVLPMQTLRKISAGHRSARHKRAGAHRLFDCEGILLLLIVVPYCTFFGILS